jgi:hypothetical protein
MKVWSFIVVKVAREEGKEASLKCDYEMIVVDDKEPSSPVEHLLPERFWESVADGEYFPSLTDDSLTMTQCDGTTTVQNEVSEWIQKHKKLLLAYGELSVTFPEEEDAPFPSLAVTYPYGHEVTPRAHLFETGKFHKEKFESDLWRINEDVLPELQIP